MSSIEISKATGRQAGLQRSVQLGWQHKPWHAMLNRSVHLLPFSLPAYLWSTFAFQRTSAYLCITKFNINNYIFCPPTRFCAVRTRCSRTVQVLFLFQRGPCQLVAGLSNSEARVQSRASPLEICGVLMALEHVFTREFRFSGRSHWPRGLRCVSVTACLLGLWVRMQPGAWMFCCECCALSSRGLCVGLIARPGSYRVWYAWVWWRSLDNGEALAK